MRLERMFAANRALYVLAAAVLVAVAADASASAPAKVPGIGATQAAWDATHVADDRFARGAAYDPNPKLGDGSRFDDRYYTVEWTAGRVTSYSMRLERGTGIKLARTVLMREFPSDAKVDWFITKAACAQMEVRSATLGRALRNRKIGDPTGTVLVEFLTGGTYSPGNVTDALLVLSPPSSPHGAGC
jgi:hypothetical protein